MRGKNELSIAVLGPGAVGGFLAAIFCRAGFSVTCVAKELSAQAIAHDGIRLESAAFGDFISHPKVVTKLDTKCDILFVTTKSIGLNDAIKHIQPELLAEGVVIPLLNGIEHMGILKGYFGRCVIAASIGNVELKKVSDIHVIHSTAFPAKIDFASDGDIEEDRLSEVAKILSSVGIDATVLDSEDHVLWSKLVRLNALACTTSASGKLIGFIRTDAKWRKMLEGCVAEGVAIAGAEGIKMDISTVMAQIDRLPKEMGTSMQRDIAAGKISEIDTVAGAVVRAGKKHGIDCPTIESLISMVNSKFVKA